jgi:LPXTG-site transpeptidase (sortase) family protein
MSDFGSSPQPPAGRHSPLSAFRQRLANWFLSLSLRQRQAVAIGAPLAVIAIAAALVVAIVLATSGSGNGDGKEVAAKVTATSSASDGQGEGLLQEQLDDLKKLEQDLLAKRGTPQNGISGTNPDAPVPGGEGDRLIIPSISVNAPMTLRVVGADGVMQNPEGPTDVAYYDFSVFPNMGGRPGAGGNTVISGHVDYHDYGPAVFWDIRKLEPGAEITIHLRDGSEYKYKVEWNRTLDPASTAWNEIVAATPQESVTMITCAGTFDPATRSYDQRRVVWAIRVS